LHKITFIFLFIKYDYIKKLKKRYFFKRLILIRKAKKDFLKKHYYFKKLISKNKFSIYIKLTNVLNEIYFNFNVNKRIMLKEFYNF